MSSRDFMILAEDDFIDRFQPQTNHLLSSAPFNDCMYETFGTELCYVKQVYKTRPLTVWTVLDCDGPMFIANGLHCVNRMGYLITAKPADEKTDYEIQCEDLCDNDEIELEEMEA